MTLAPGIQFGPYRIVAAIGAGGMGEVYRAHDTRLGRDVAMKVLSPHLAATPEARARFEREARTISQLNHPHICTLFDIGREGETDYLVMELVDGETLAQRLEKGPLLIAEVLSIGRQIAEALDRAHRAGVVHRDLKPGNVMLTKGGAKLMDFGLARSHAPGPVAGATAQSPTISGPLTTEGTIVGTFQYMAPEQLEGKEADERSDIWALGCVLHEMATGARAFAGESQASLIAAIMTGEPRAMTELRPLMPPTLERVATRCFRKDPDERFQSASDLAFALENLGGASAPDKVMMLPRPRWRRWVAPTMALVLVAAAVAVTSMIAHRSAKPMMPSYERLTFRRGAVVSARFGPDGQSVVYSARFSGEKPGLYVQRMGTPDARRLDLRGRVVGVSGGEIAILRADTLSRAPIEGGTARDVAVGVFRADWSADGSQFAIVRGFIAASSCSLECPIGRLLLRTTGGAALAAPRISPSGDRIAYAWLDTWTNLSGRVEVMDLAGRKQMSSGGWAKLGTNLSWSSDGREVLFAGEKKGMVRAVYAVDMRGRERLVLRTPSDLDLNDVGSDGRLLLTELERRLEARGRMAGDSAERDLSWLDGTCTPVLTPDGKQMLFQEWGEGGGEWSTAYMRRADGQPPVRLSDGTPVGVSKDGRWALVAAGPTRRLELRMVPTGAGEAYVLPRGSIDQVIWAYLSPDEKHVVTIGSETGKPQRFWIQELPSGLPRPFGPDDLREEWGRSTPDGRWWLARPPGPPAPALLYPADGGEPRSVKGLRAEDAPVRWSDDGRWLYVQNRSDKPPIGVTRIDTQTGRREPWLTLAPPDMTGVLPDWAGIETLTPDGRCYAYQYVRELSALYLVTGVR